VDWPYSLWQKFSWVILDEGNMVKNYDTQTHLAVRWLDA